jgi:NTE family protein
MGGIIGAAYASGIPIQDIEAETQRVRKRRVLLRLLDLTFIGGSLLKGTRIYQYIASMLGENLTFEDLKFPFAVVAVDLNTGRQVVLQEGKVVYAVRATMSVPGVFEPVRSGSLRLADGGVLNNVPVDVARSLGAEVVIAVDVLPHFTPNVPGEHPLVHPLKLPYTPEAIQELMHVEFVMISELTDFRLREAKPDLVLRPVLPVEMSLFIGFDRADEAVRAGEEAAEEALPRIRELVPKNV